jgi:ring-1,2-phenylacetyl-CoA epoxidase subunit PaaC
VSPASIAAATAAAPTPAPQAKLRYVLRLADASLVLAQRLGEWIGHAPALEEDLGLANTALDLLGQARLLLSYAGELEGQGRDEDALAFLREEREFLNPTLVEQPNGDFAHTIVRQFLFDAWQHELYAGLVSSSDPRLAAVAAKALKETRYHLSYSTGWVVRLGDGTEESRARMQRALDTLWPYTNELTDADTIDREMIAAGIAPAAEGLAAAWSARVDAVLAEATLARPAATSFRWYGKQGRHSEHLGHLLADMQYLPRTFPGSTW